MTEQSIEITQPHLPSQAYEEGRLAWHQGLAPDQCPYLLKWKCDTNIEAYEWIKGWSDVSRSDAAFFDENTFDFNTDGE